MSFAGNGRNMYNQTSFIAIVQQAIKKPLVTELLPRSSYPRGWRCEYNYDQFYWVGQVTHRFIPSPRTTRTENGDGFPTSKPPITALCVRFFTAVAVCCVRFSLFLASPMVVHGPGSPFQQKQRTPGIGSTWLSLISLSNCIFAELPALAAPSVRSPFVGEGGIVPAAVLSGERIAQTGLDVKAQAHEAVVGKI